MTFKNCTALESVTLGAGIKKLIGKEGCAFDGCVSLKTINVPAKKAEYYKQRLVSPTSSDGIVLSNEPMKPEDLHSLIVELPAEKKAKK